MPRKGKGKPTGRKAGAQAGNKNALRHGFYSKSFTPDENKRLDSQDPTDVKAEIALIRVCIDKLKNELDFDASWHKDTNGNQTRDDHYLKALNTLSIMTQSLSTLTRTHYLVRGKSGDVADSIMRALEELRLEMGI
jgi:meiotically up-regulated gene 157 (Mug157) protein